MTPFLLILGLFVLVTAGAHFAGIVILLLRPLLSRDPKPAERPPVTILRPACGIENFVEETLRSSFAVDYPEYELIFCVADPTDPVVPLIRRLMDEHPAVPSRLLLGDDRISINPKLNNLVKGWHAAKHDWIVMADSNVLIPHYYIDQMLARFRPDVGLVCSPALATQPVGGAAELEVAFLNTHQARWQMLADALGFAYAQGKTMFWKRAILNDNGGIEALARRTAEDIASTQLVRGAGYKVRLVKHPFPQPLGERTFAQVWRRQQRWMRVAARCKRSTSPCSAARGTRVLTSTLQLKGSKAQFTRAAGSLTNAAVSRRSTCRWEGGDGVTVRVQQDTAMSESPA